MAMEIVLERTKFEAGQVVAGVFKLGTQSRPAEVRIELDGDAEVDWVEIPGNVLGMHGSVAILPDLTYHETKCCLNMVHEVSDKEIIDNGEIPFEFKLPENGIPSSFENSDAKIFYKITASVKTADGQRYSIEKAIQVLAPITDNLKVAVGNIVEKDFGLLSLGSGKIILQAIVKKKGFAPGESIQVHCGIFNESSVEVTPRATLYQTLVYLCADRQKASQSAITAPVIGDKVDKHSTAERVLSIAVPKETPLTIKSGIIAVKYFIHVTLDVRHAFDAHLNLPIVVTTESALEDKQ